MKEIRIDGVIGQDEGEVSAAWLRAELPDTSEPVRISIHSEGGSVFEGFAIYDVLAKYQGQKTVAVESTAFSIASFIAMAADEVEMSPNAYFMLHNPRINMEGDDEELGKTAGMITSLKNNMVEAYANRTGKTTEEIQTILKAETYFNAAEAVAFGLADRITETPIKARAFAQLKNMPHRVVAALFGAGSGGDNDSEKGKTMTESKPVAATLQEIEAAFPKASEKFLVKCLRRNLPLASVATAAAEEMMAENDELKKQVTAMQEEIAKYKAMDEDDDAEAKAMDDEDDAEAKAKAMDDDEDEAEARAKARSRRGVKPVAKGTSGRPSASVRWENAVEAAMAKTKNKMQAVALASRQNPGLREAYVAEVNAR